MVVDLAPESFKQQVRDCLTHLYDITVLQTNPLVSRIAPELTGLQRVQLVRRVLIETIEQLKVRETTGIPSRQERVYSLLLMRYVEGLPISEVMQQLALSERQFYRENHRAIQTVSQLLWDHLKTGQIPDDAISVKSEIQRLSRLPSYETIDVKALLSGVIAANANLAERHQVTLHLHPLQALGDFNTHQTLLRQTLIWMLSQIIMHLVEGSDVALSAATVDHHSTINFEISDSGIDISSLRETLTNSPTVAEFLATLKGTIRVTQRDCSSYLVQFQLQRERQVILVIDDNPDVVALLERYITGMPYEIVSTYDADEGFHMSKILELSHIVLDILLPHTDGWKMLQNLKSHPQTQSIPVLVCSVLENPDLALSLGADAYLRKPPDRISFLEALGRRSASEH
jgi:CheY-like chemotaxis protein